MGSESIRAEFKTDHMTWNIVVEPQVPPTGSLSENLAYYLKRYDYQSFDKFIFQRNNEGRIELVLIQSDEGRTIPLRLDEWIVPSGDVSDSEYYTLVNRFTENFKGCGSYERGKSHFVCDGNGKVVSIEFSIGTRGRFSLNVGEYEHQLCPMTCFCSVEQALDMWNSEFRRLLYSEGLNSRVCKVSVPDEVMGISAFRHMRGYIDRYLLSVGNKHMVDANADADEVRLIQPVMATFLYPFREFQSRVLDVNSEVMQRELGIDLIIEKVVVTEDLAFILKSKYNNISFNMVMKLRTDSIAKHVDLALCKFDGFMSIEVDGELKKRLNLKDIGEECVKNAYAGLKESLFLGKLIDLLKDMLFDEVSCIQRNPQAGDSRVVI